MRKFFVFMGLLAMVASSSVVRAEQSPSLEDHHWGLEILSAKSKSYFSRNHAPSVIRFLDSDDNPLNDLVIGFDESLFIKTFEWYLSSFVWEKNRRVTRVILPSTPEMIENLKDLAATQGSDSSISVYGTKEMKLHQFLEAAGILQSQSKKSFTKPLAEVLRRAGATLFPDFVISDFSRDYRNVICRYLEKSQSKNPCLRKIVRNRFLEWEFSRNQQSLDLKSDERFWSFLLTDVLAREKVFFMRFGSIFHLDLGNRIFSNDPDLLEWPFEKFIASFPKELYGICQVRDQECRDKRINAMRSKWSTSTLKGWASHLQAGRPQHSKAVDELYLDMMELGREISRINHSVID